MEWKKCRRRRRKRRRRRRRRKHKREAESGMLSQQSRTAPLQPTVLNHAMTRFATWSAIFMAPSNIKGAGCQRQPLTFREPSPHSSPHVLPLPQPSTRGFEKQKNKNLVKPARNRAQSNPQRSAKPHGRTWKK